MARSGDSAESDSMKGLSRKERLARQREERRESQRVEAEAEASRAAAKKAERAHHASEDFYNEEDAAQLSLKDRSASSSRESRAGYASSSSSRQEMYTVTDSNKTQDQLVNDSLRRDSLDQAQSADSDIKQSRASRRRSRQMDASNTATEEHTEKTSVTFDEVATEESSAQAEIAGSASSRRRQRLMKAKELAQAERAEPEEDDATLENQSSKVKTESPSLLEARSSRRTASPLSPPPTPQSNPLEDTKRPASAHSKNPVHMPQPSARNEQESYEDVASAASATVDSTPLQEESKEGGELSADMSLDGLSVRVNLTEGGESVYQEESNGEYDSSSQTISPSRGFVSGTKRIESPVRLKKKQLLTCAIYGETPPPDIKIQPIRSGNAVGRGPPPRLNKKKAPASDAAQREMQTRHVEQEEVLAAVRAASPSPRAKSPLCRKYQQRQQYQQPRQPRQPRHQQNEPRDSTRRGSDRSMESANLSLAPNVSSFASSPDIPLLDLSRGTELLPKGQYHPSAPDTSRKVRHGYSPRAQRTRKAPKSPQSPGSPSEWRSPSPSGASWRSPSPQGPVFHIEQPRISSYSEHRRPRGRARVRPKNHGKSSGKKVNALVERSFTPQEANKISRRFRTKVDSLLGRAKLHASTGTVLPGDTKVQVTVQDLADVSALLSTFESENRRLAQAASKRIVADRAALAAIQELVEEVGAEVEQALPEMETSIEASQQQQQQQQTQQQQGQGQPNDAPELRSTSQAHLWIQQARAVKEVLAREVGQQHPAVYSDNASVAAVFDAASVPGSDYCSAARVEPAHDILPTVAVQALEVACGLTRTFQQACQEGLESADKIIRQLYARQEQQSNGANNQRPACTEPPAQHQ